MKNYETLSDEDLLLLHRAGDARAEEALYARYKQIVRSKARTYFLIGADREDIIQEGMIGLYKAVVDYQFDRLASFRGFAELCITRQIISAIKAATRKKPLRPLGGEDRPRPGRDPRQRASPGRSRRHPFGLVVVRPLPGPRRVRSRHAPPARRLARRLAGHRGRQARGADGARPADDGKQSGGRAGVVRRVRRRGP